MDFDDPDSGDVLEREVNESPETDKPSPAIPAAIPQKRHSGSPIQSKKPSEIKADPLKKPEPEDIDFEDDLDSGLEDEIEVSEQPQEESLGNPSDEELESSPEPEEVVAEETEDPIPETDTPQETTNPTKSTEPTIFQRLLGSLSKTEKIGISALVAILALAATFGLLHFSKVPTRPLISAPLDLPIAGKLVNVTSAATFWREPVTGGDSPDIVRRGTKLIPVLTLQVEAKSAAVRVLFRNEDGLVVGDPINRSIKGKTKLTIPATAGFDDIGMHAAYRTGESPPWSVQVLEASQSGDSIDNFTTLLETEISTDIR